MLCMVMQAPLQHYLGGLGHGSNTTGRLNVNERVAASGHGAAEPLWGPVHGHIRESHALNPNPLLRSSQHELWGPRPLDYFGGKGLVQAPPKTSEQDALPDMRTIFNPQARALIRL